MAICRQISSLGDYLKTKKYDILQLHNYVRLLRKALEAKREQTSAILPSLFRAYATVPDKVFADYMGHKLESYEEGSDLTDKQIMHFAQLKHDLLKQMGEWCVLTLEDEKNWPWRLKSRPYTRIVTTTIQRRPKGPRIKNIKGTRRQDMNTGHTGHINNKKIKITHGW